MTEQTFNNVWQALEDDPVQARNYALRSELMAEVSEALKQAGYNQAQAAKALGITQPRVSDLLNGKIEKFRIDMLVNFALTLGLDVQLAVAA